MIQFEKRHHRFHRGTCNHNFRADFVEIRQCVISQIQYQRAFWCVSMEVGPGARTVCPAYNESSCLCPVLTGWLFSNGAKLGAFAWLIGRLVGPIKSDPLEETYDARRPCGMRNITDIHPPTAKESRNLLKRTSTGLQEVSLTFAGEDHLSFL